MGSIQKTFKCKTFPGSIIDFDGRPETDDVFIEVVTSVSGKRKYQNITISKDELIKYVEKIKGEK